MVMPLRVVPYDAGFLGGGFVVPLPVLSAGLRKEAYRGGMVLDYVHFSLVMSARRRMAFFSACNVDAERKVSGIGRDGVEWRADERAEDVQLTEAVYKRTAWDRGHLTRREDVIWGTRAVARAANESTFFMTNAVPQHYRFNQDEWVALEDWVLDVATDLSYRLCVMTGPVLSEKDPLWFPAKRGVDPRTIRIPAAFWKVIVLRDQRAGGKDLAVISFAMRQTEMWDDADGARMLDLRVHQVPLRTIERWTGLSFGELKNADELSFPSRSGRRGLVPTEFPLIEKRGDICFRGEERRRAGVRVLPRGGDVERTRGVGEVDLREEVAALRARVEVLEGRVGGGDGA